MECSAFSLLILNKGTRTINKDEYILKLKKSDYYKGILYEYYIGILFSYGGFLILWVGLYTSLKSKRGKE